MLCLPDINVWLALTLDLHVHHAPCTDWIDGPGVKAAFCRVSQQGLFRLLTTGAIMERYGVAPLTNKEAWTVFDGYMDDSRISYCDEPGEVQNTWRKLASQRTSSPKLWMDAYLASFAIAGGYRLVTTDKGFKQFKHLDYLLLA